MGWRAPSEGILASFSVVPGAGPGWGPRRGPPAGAVIGLSYLFCKIGLSRQRCLLCPTRPGSDALSCFAAVTPRPLEPLLQKVVCKRRGACPGVGFVVLGAVRLPCVASGGRGPILGRERDTGGNGRAEGGAGVGGGVPGSAMVVSLRLQGSRHVCWQFGGAWFSGDGRVACGAAGVAGRAEGRGALLGSPSAPRFSLLEKSRTGGCRGSQNSGALRGRRLCHRLEPWLGRTHVPVHLGLHVISKSSWLRGHPRALLDLCEFSSYLDQAAVPGSEGGASGITGLGGVQQRVLSGRAVRCVAPSGIPRRAVEGGQLGGGTAHDAGAEGSEAGDILVLCALEGRRREEERLPPHYCHLERAWRGSLLSHRLVTCSLAQASSAVTGQRVCPRRREVGAQTSERLRGCWELCPAGTVPSDHRGLSGSGRGPGVMGPRLPCGLSSCLPACRSFVPSFTHPADLRGVCIGRCGGARGSACGAGDGRGRGCPSTFAPATSRCCLSFVREARSISAHSVVTHHHCLSGECSVPSSGRAAQMLLTAAAWALFQEPAHGRSSLTPAQESSNKSPCAPVWPGVWTLSQGMPPAPRLPWPRVPGTRGRCSLAPRLTSLGTREGLRVARPAGWGPPGGWSSGGGGSRNTYWETRAFGDLEVPWGGRTRLTLS